MSIFFILYFFVFLIILLEYVKKISESFTTIDEKNNFKKYKKFSKQIKTYYGECRYTPSKYIEEIPHITLNGYFINDLLVYTPYRNKGYGTKILNRIINMARKEGKLHLISQVKARNTPAIKLHEKVGFYPFFRGIDKDSKEVIVYVFNL